VVFATFKPRKYYQTHPKQSLELLVLKNRDDGDTTRLNLWHRGETAKISTFEPVPEPRPHYLDELEDRQDRIAEAMRPEDVQF
jgi:hypothetical protein